jgi:hypothetical protein
MGFNSTVVVMNDALDMIRDDPQFGERLYRAVLEVGRGKPVDVSAHTKRGIHCNAATVVESHHADYDVFVKVGGNYGEVAKGVDSLIYAAKEFVQKVERGEAHSKRSYKAFKDALAKLST